MLVIGHNKRKSTNRSETNSNPNSSTSCHQLQWFGDFLISWQGFTCEAKNQWVEKKGYPILFNLKADGIWAARPQDICALEEKIRTEELCEPLHYPIVRPGAIKQWGHFDKFWQEIIFAFGLLAAIWLCFKSGQVTLLLQSGLIFCGTVKIFLGIFWLWETCWNLFYSLWFTG